MQSPTSEHLWSLAEHFMTALPYVTAFFFWIRRRFKHLVREAVREEIWPMKQQIDEVYPWYQIVSRAFGDKKANGHYAGAD